MKSILCLMVITPLVVGDDLSPKVATALALTFGQERKPLSYTDAHAESLRTGKPLIVWVGRPNRDVAGYICCSVASLDGYKPPCCVVSVPVEGVIFWRATLPAIPTDEEIHDVIRKQAGLWPVAVPSTAPFLASPAASGGPVRFQNS